MKLRLNACGKVVVLATLVTAMTACNGQKNMYNWGGYSNNLLGYYKNQDTEQLQKFSATLFEAIQEAETDDTVPPGLYAEYGYTLLELDDANTASIYFQKEWEKWPESRFLMDKVMARLTTTTPESSAPSASEGM